ncbi:phosphoglycerate mutase Gpm [Gottschalkia purinilytica]|uniref:Phosphoglycerate mutase Gpm n=1 Tax=Gottschalkia purinilytica TaxID=1503 RepID=A0A0L0W7K9_GOTPU|nr:histidine phosphatase family protein [Gottschalkia purinilytica]KNF07442.1 phosphoglycerate mutase Gpm [Gottschalkia purinilytica]
MTKLYLVRHGQSEWNILNKVQGQEDTKLTEQGIAQAKKVANRLSKEDIDLIYCSDLKRAHDTAKIIGDKINLPVNSLKDFREINFGIWQGLTLDEVKEKYKEQNIIWRTEPHNFKLDRAEKLIDVQERMMNKVNDILKNNPDKNVLIVSHGTAIKSLLLGILNIDLSNYGKISIGNVGLSIIEFRDYFPVIRVLNDTSHLREE